ncbi:gliding motility-associated-like protein [Chitinophaga skermanii]|uniref:Gliding motility-associated-like protein n=2 Tax=Chitinophaga skermanii TaxID=331697 RepID=A0A327QMX8_9BACT|nr:gliding motility-associated-like protein [Chitinophaga skermanii]
MYDFLLTKNMAMCKSTLSLWRKTLLCLFILLFTQQAVRAQFTLRESFGDNTLTSPRIILGGSAQLTAAAGIDPLGAGWLRLTGDSTNQVGYCYVNESFPSNLGLFVEFEYTAWAPSTRPEADGFAVYLFDAAYGPGTFQIGQDGGALGYGEVDKATHPTGWSLGPGLTGGYIGVGLDEFGNYSVKQTVNDNLSKGFLPHTIAVRGTTANHTPYLAGTGANLGGTVYAGQKISYGTPIATRPSSDNFYRKVQVLIEKVGANYQLTVSMQFSQSGSMNKVFGPILLSDPPPANLKVGFAASTGLYTNNHEIKNLYVTTPGAIHTEKSGPVVITNRDSVVYNVGVFNDSPSPIPNIPVTDTLPTWFTAQNVSFNNNGYISNTYDGNGSIVGNVFRGGTVNLQAYSRGTFRFAGRMVFTDSIPRIIKNLAYSKSPTGFSDPDASNDTSVTYAYRKPVLQVPSTTVNICSGTPTPINLQTLHNATISWTASVTAGTVGGVANGSAVASSTGTYTFAPTLTNTGTTVGTVVYTFTPSYTYTSPDDGSSVVVNGEPVRVTYTVQPQNQPMALPGVTVCSGDSIPPRTFTSPIAGTTFSWTNNNTSIGLPGSGSGATVPGFVAINNGNAPVIAKIAVTTSAAGCNTTDTLTITVNPLPKSSFAVNQASQCLTGNSFVFTNTTAGTNATYVWDFGDGTTSTATSPTHSYTTTGDFIVKLVSTNGNGCKDSIARTVTVNITPQVSFVYAIISPNSNNVFQFTNKTVITPPEDTGVVYFWDFGDGISSTLENPSHTYTTNGTYTVRLTVTTRSGCSASASETIVVTIDPNVNGKFTINQSEQCLTGNNFVFTNTTTVTPGTTIAGYEWNFGDNTAISTVTSPSHVYATAGTYVVTLTVITTTGYRQTVTQTVVVKPVPTVVKPADQILCVGQPTTAINFTGSVPGTMYNWVNSNPAIGVAASGSGNIPSFTTTNSTQSNSVATFTVTPSFDGCIGAAQTFTITVKPSPRVNPTADQALCAGGTTQAVAFTSAVQNTTFSWTNSNTTTGLQTSGTGNIAAFTAINTGATSITSSVIVQAAAAGCTGTRDTFNITVYPIPVLNNSLTPTPICDNSVFSYEPTSGTPGATFTWQRDAVPGISNATASGTGNPRELLDNTTDSVVTVTYRFTITANGCSNVQLVRLGVRPTPTLSTNLTPAAICSGNPFYYEPGSGTPNTTFTWTRNAVPGIANPASSGVGIIDERLVNTTDGPINVFYTYLLNANGCGGTGNVTVTVKPLPVLTSTTTPAAVCAGTPFVYSPTASLPGTTFAWSRAAIAGVSNPAASGVNGINETLQITDQASHQVPYVYTLTANACSNTDTVFAQVQPLPALQLTINDTTQCLQGNNFVFTNTSAVSGATYTWNFGDGETATTANATHAYKLAGTYTVTLRGITAAGCTAVVSRTVVVYNSPVAGFVYNIISPNSNDEFQFTNTSSSSAGTLTYAWDFGDGATSTLKDPTHLYADSGIYVVRLTVTNQQGCTATVTSQIRVTKYQNVVAGFDVTPDAQCLTGNNFVFNNTTTAAGGASVASYLWEFGDGTSSTLANPTHTYTSSGTYTVILTVTGSNGFVDAVSKSVTVLPTPVIAPVTNQTLCNGATSNNINFNASPTAATFTWTNNTPSIGLPASGNDNISPFTVVNTGTTPVIATITLTPRLFSCTGTAETFTITVLPTPTVSGFADQTVCNGAQVPATNFTSTVTGITFSWTNDNTRIGLAASGSGSITAFTGVNTSASPEIATIKVTPRGGTCAGAEQQYTITVQPTPILTSSLQGGTICSNATFNYTPSSNTTGVIYNWTRAAVSGISNASGSGVGNISETLVNTTNARIAVTYVYTLSSNGCVNPTTYNVVVNVDPTPVLSSSLIPAGICSGAEFNYSPSSVTNGATFSWSRAAIAGISNPAASGVNNPNEVLINTTNAPITVVYQYTITANGCSNVQQVSVVVSPIPGTAFTINNAVQCLQGNSFVFTNTTTGSGTLTYAWDFGDGKTATTANATHTYTAEGTYDVTLKVTGNEGCATSTVVNQVRVDPVPSPNFTFMSDPFGSTKTFEFTNNSTISNGTLSYVWNFGDGTTSTDENPTHTYAAQGNYNVRLTVTETSNGTSCAAYIQKTLVIIDDPNVVARIDVNTTSQCLKDNIFVFSGFASTATNPIVVYNWDFGDGTTALGMNPTHTYAAAGNYTVELAVIDDMGNVNIATVSLIVNATPVVTGLRNITVCNGSTVNQINFSGTPNTIFTWSNTFAAIGLPTSGTDFIPSFVATNTTQAPLASFINVTPTLQGCPGEARSFLITVNPTTTVNTVSNQVKCNGETVAAINFTSPVAGTTYTWVNDNTRIGLNASGTGNIASFTGINTGNTTEVANITITPVINGCVGTASTFTITIHPTPIMNSNNDAGVICSGETFTYTPSSLVAVASFNWTRASIPGISNPAATGTGNVSEVLVNTTTAPIDVVYAYTASANGCANTVPYNVKVRVLPSPVLSSSVTPTAICSGTMLNYSPTSAISGVTFSWSRAAVAGISNGAASGTGNPNEILTNTTSLPVNVVYQYTLAANGCTNTQQVTVTVLPLPTVGFTINNDPQCITGNNYEFTNTSNIGSGTLTYTWDLGDGTILTTQNATHAYQADGQYNVVLTATSSDGCASEAYRETITVLPSPVAGFTYRIIAPNSNDEYQFISTVTRIRKGTLTTYHWMFGDGTESFEQNPMHTYQNSGLYIVTLMVTADNGCTSVARNTITVTKNPNVVAKFDINPITACLPGNLFAFTNTSTITGGVTVIGATWDFGDGTTSTDANPTHTYAAAGVYTVTLSVETSTGFISEATRTVQVFAVPTITVPSNTVVCANESVTIPSFAGTITAATYTWTNDNPAIGLSAGGTGNIPIFTATNTSNVPITATITVIATENNCSSAPSTFTITVNPVPAVNPVASQTLCAGATTTAVNFSGPVAGTTYSWTNSNPTIGLPGSGTGNIPAFATPPLNKSLLVATITVTPTANGCTGAPISFQYTIDPAPGLTSTLTPSAICSATPLNYIPTSNEPSATFTWTRAAVPGISNPAATGTGNIAETLINTTAQPVTVNYIYTVRATGCSATTATVSVVVKPQPTLSSTTTPPSICNNTVFDYAPTANVPGAQITWQRNAFSSLANPAASGTGNPNEILENVTTDIARAIYSFTVNADGCVSSQNVVVVVAPSLRLSSETQLAPICSGTSLTYEGKTATPGATLTWRREAIPGISNPASSGTGNIMETLMNTTNAPVEIVYTYSVSFINCTDTQQVRITVNPAASLVSTLADQVLCGGATAPAVPLRGAVPGTMFTWTNSNENTGLGASGSGDVPSFMASTGFDRAVNGRVSISATTPEGCRLLEPAGYNVTVNPTPAGTILTPKGTYICEGFSLPLITSGGNAYQWYKNDVLINGATNAVYEATDSGTYSVSIFTLAGCSADKVGNVKISSVAKPVASFTFDRYCEGIPVTFTNTSQVQDTMDVLYSWVDNAGHASTLKSPTFTYNNGGSYMVQLKVTPMSCPLLADSVAKNIVIDVPVAGMILPTVNTTPNVPTLLNARNIGNTSWAWTPTTGLSNPAIQNPTATLTQTQLYRITMEMPSGCVTTDSLQVRVLGNDDIYIPNVISPNGDGKNDRWVIVGLERYPNSHVSIYNRWGNQVYENKSYDNSWTGDGLLESTYYYVLKLRLQTGEIKIYKGYIQLIR